MKRTLQQLAQPLAGGGGGSAVPTNDAVYTSTEFFSRIQWGPREMPGLATQADWGRRSRGSAHGSKSQRASAEKRAGERNRTL